MTNPKITSNNGVFVPPLSVDTKQKAGQKNDVAGPENPGTSKMDAQQAKNREAAKREQLLRFYPEWGHLYDGSAENSSSTNLEKPHIAESSDENSDIHKSGFYDDDWKSKIRDRLRLVSSQKIKSILDRKEKDTSQPAGSSKFDVSAFSQTLLNLNSSSWTNVLQSRPGFPDVPINKASLKSFCANLRKEGVDADALQELKDAIDGKKDVTEAAIFGKLTNSPATKKGKGKSTDPAELLVSSYVATQLASCFKSSYPRTADSRRRDLGRALILKLIEISCKNSTSKDTEWLALLPELEFWSKAESSLQKWMPKEDIVATREKFLSEMREWKDKEQHIDNIAEMCICESRAIYDAFDEKIKTLDDLIDQYINTLDSKKKVGGAPDHKDVEDLRSYIDELVTGIGLDKLNPWSVNGPKQAGMLKTYEEKTEAIREGSKETGRKTGTTLLQSRSIKL
jgi:hypothetical protein